MGRHTSDTTMQEQLQGTHTLGRKVVNKGDHVRQISHKKNRHRVLQKLPLGCDIEVVRGTFRSPNQAASSVERSEWPIPSQRAFLTGQPRPRVPCIFAAQTAWNPHLRPPASPRTTGAHHVPQAQSANMSLHSQQRLQTRRWGPQMMVLTTKGGP